MEQTRLTADGVKIEKGSRVFNYYDCKWGVVTELNTHDEWFELQHDDGTTALLNGQRVSSVKPSWMK
jgi:hypothetical protein